jgi:hypothetical protein
LERDWMGFGWANREREGLGDRGAEMVETME